MAVFLMSEGWTGIWWYPFLKSSLLKMVAPARLPGLVEGNSQLLR